MTNGVDADGDGIRDDVGHRIGVKRKTVSIGTVNRGTTVNYLAPYSGDASHNAVNFQIPDNHTAVETWWAPKGNIDELPNLALIDVVLTDKQGPEITVDLRLRGNKGKEAACTITIYVMYVPDRFAQ